MPRSAVLVPITVVSLLSVAAIAGGLGGGAAAASPQPTPVCSVCGQTFHENVTVTNATLQVTERGDIEWRVENELAEPTASVWRENPEAAERQYREAVEYGFQVPYDPADPTVEVFGDTVVIEFVDRGVARQRLGLLVVPYFHGEGSVFRWVVNADELVVVAPDGHRIVNEPAGADVEGDRAVWRGAVGESSPPAVSSAAPEPGDTYVVAGAGITAGARGAALTPMLPLDPFSYGAYGVGLLVVLGLSYGIYRTGRSRFDRAALLAGLAIVALPYVAFVVSVHPLVRKGFAVLLWTIYGPLLVILLGLIGGGALYVAASFLGDDPG